MTKAKDRMLVDCQNQTPISRTDITKYLRAQVLAKPQLKEDVLNVMYQIEGDTGELADIWIVSRCGAILG